jgi:DNA-binding XRE family transcriptional regulator
MRTANYRNDSGSSRRPPVSKNRLPVMKMTKNTADFVRDAREKLKLTQEQMAEQLGLERRTIIRYERGGNLPATVRMAITHLLAHNKKG